MRENNIVKIEISNAVMIVALSILGAFLIVSNIFKSITKVKLNKK